MKNYICRVCGEEFRNSSDYKDHLLEELQITERQRRDLEDDLREVKE